jgi:hypothetical protein
MPVECEHGTACHDGTLPSSAAAASAPEASKAWLLIEHPGPWPAEPTEAALPPKLHALVTAADALGIRVQLIRRPGRRSRWDPDQPVTLFAGWTAGDSPWLRRGISYGDSFSGSIGGSVGLDLEALAAGRPPLFGVPMNEPIFLVCTHARRNACCGRFGLPLAAGLSSLYPTQVWETSHVGGHKFAANLVLLPHGLYYGPVDAEGAVLAIEAYRSGGVALSRYRGRAGQAREEQAAEYERLSAGLTCS